MGYLTTVLIVGALIAIHELGHLLAALAVRIPVERFSLGFGPVLWARRFRGVEYCLSLVPLGGYVMPRIADEDELRRIPVGRRVTLWIGGPLANFLAAGFCLQVLSALANGFSWYGQLVEPWLELCRLSAEFVATLGVVLTHPQHLSGLIGIVAAGKSVVGSGLASTLKFTVLLNLNLAIFNLLPIAPLDGGKILFSLLEKIDARLARWQTGCSLAGLALILLLMVYTTVLDVMRQFA